MTREPNVVLVLALFVALLAAPLTASARDAPPPVERRAREFLDLLRQDDEAASRRFIHESMHPSFLELGPVDVHLEQFAAIREELGDFELLQIRLMNPHRGDFILRTGAGKEVVMHLETEPIVPFRVAGLGLQDHKSIRDVPEYESLEDAEDHLQRLADANEFSGVVLVAREGRPDWVRAWGMANKEKGIANRPETRFDVGSITKTFTAVAVMQLVEEEKIDLQAPMSRYLEGFRPDIADRVRVIDLLRMRSGYGDYFVKSFLDRREEFTSIPDYLELFRTFELEFEPDTDERYSNVGYVILGGIIEAVTGISYHDYVRTRIFEPAGMEGSSFRGLNQEDPLAAVGYTNDGTSGRSGFVETNRSLLDVRGNPSGGSFSPAADLLRFDRALRGNELLSEAGTTLVLNRFEEKTDRPTVRGTAGGAPGVSAVNLEDLEAGLTVIVLSNYDEPLAELIGEQIFRTLRRERKEPSAKEVVVPMDLVGTQPAVEVRIGGEGPFLFLIDTGAAGAGRISRELADRFGLEVVGQVEAGDPSGRNSETRDLVRVAELRMGEHVWHDIDMLMAGDARVDPGIDGILGFELFQGGLFTLDYPGRKVRLQPGELPTPDGRDILPFRDERGVPTIDLEVAGRRLEADVDSGSMGWLMVPEKVAQTLPLKADPVVVGKARTAFNEFEIKSAPLEGEVRVGRHRLTDPKLEFASIFPHGNVGGQFLSLFVVTFDRKNRRIRLTRDTEAPLARKPRYSVGVMLGLGPEGMVVQDTVPELPAARAGLRSGDRILSINGTPVDEMGPGDLPRIFSTPEEVVLSVGRGDETLEVRLTPEPS